MITRLARPVRYQRRKEKHNRKKDLHTEKVPASGSRGLQATPVELLHAETMMLLMQEQLELLQAKDPSRLRAGVRQLLSRYGGKLQRTCVNVEHIPYRKRPDVERPVGISYH